MKKFIISIAIIISIANAGTVGGYGGSLESTQWAKWSWEQFTKWPKELVELQNNLEKFKKWQEELLAYQNLVNNIGSLPQEIKERFMKQLLEMKKAVEFGDALSYTAASFDQDFRNKFKGFDEWLKLANANEVDFQETYKQLNNSTRDTIQGALKALQFQEEDLATDANFMDAIHSKMQTAKGEKEMLLLANEIAAHQTERMKALQKTIMTQVNMEAEYYAKQNEQEAIQRAKEEAFYKKSDFSLSDPSTYRSPTRQRK